MCPPSTSLKEVRTIYSWYITFWPSMHWYTPREAAWSQSRLVRSINLLATLALLLTLVVLGLETTSIIFDLIHSMSFAGFYCPLFFLLACFSLYSICKYWTVLLFGSNRVSSLSLFLFLFVRCLSQRVAMRIRDVLLHTLLCKTFSPCLQPRSYWPLTLSFWTPRTHAYSAFLPARLGALHNFRVHITPVIPVSIMHLITRWSWLVSKQNLHVQQWFLLSMSYV